MSSRQALILKRLTDDGQKTAAYFRGLTEAHFKQQVYVTGPQWTVQHLLAHFVSAERSFKPLFTNILAGGPGVSDDFVLDDFNAQSVANLEALPTTELIAAFEAARADTFVIVQNMADADFDKIGRHPWFGNTALENMLKLVYRHNMLHERDIRKALETGQPVPHNEQ